MAKQQKKQPVRQCVGCGEQKEKKQLIRVVKNAEGEIFIDPTGKAAGRGAYLCPNSACLQLAQKKRRLERSFKGKIPDEVYERLAKEMGGG